LNVGTDSDCGLGIVGGTITGATGIFGIGDRLAAAIGVMLGAVGAAGRLLTGAAGIDIAGADTALVGAEPYVGVYVVPAVNGFTGDTFVGGVMP